MSGTNITFQTYPSTNRVPGVFAEINNSNANSASINQNSLLIGSMLSAGSATPNEPVLVSGANPDALFGAGSVLALMVKQYVGTDPFGTVYALPLADAVAAVAASATLTIGGTPTAAGVISLYIAGTLVSTAVATTDTPTSIASNMVAAITATPDLPVSAAASAGVVTITALNKGLTGNDIDLRLNYMGAAGGQALPAGVTATFGGGTQSGSGYLLGSGATNPTLTTALANLPTENFDFIATAYTDAASLSAIETFLNDTSGRWSWEQELFGGAFGAYRGTLGSLTTYGVTNNNQHVSIMGIYDVPQPAWIWAAEVTAQAATSLRANPAIPLQNVVMNLMPPPLASRFDIGERNTLLYDGLSTFKVDQGGVVVMERMVTTYQTNAAGQPDNSYLDVETMYQLAAYIRDLRSYLSSRYSRSILVADGTPIPFGSAMTTPSTVLASVIARYRSQAAVGLVQNPDVFAKQAQAQNAGNGLLKLLLPVQLANQLRDVAMLIAFTKP